MWDMGRLYTFGCLHRAEPTADDHRNNKSEAASFRDAASGQKKVEAAGTVLRAKRHHGDRSSPCP